MVSWCPLRGSANRSVILGTNDAERLVKYIKTSNSESGYAYPSRFTYVLVTWISRIILPRLGFTGRRTYSMPVNKSFHIILLNISCHQLVPSTEVAAAPAPRITLIFPSASSHPPCTVSGNPIKQKAPPAHCSLSASPAPNVVTAIDIQLQICFCKSMNPPHVSEGAIQKPSSRIHVPNDLARFTAVASKEVETY